MTTPHATLAAEAQATSAILSRRDLSVEREPDLLDMIQLQTEHETEARRVNEATRKLRLIQAAMKRIANGTYGICRDCEERIPDARLRALPWATECRGCAERRERRGAR
jgi:DnaK suppressor protein